MCGITGFITKKISYDEDIHKTIQSMTEVLAHRGPDSGDSTVFKLCKSDRTPAPLTIAFGHRRLKIIDLSNSAAQPMWNISNNICITYNGEIYNYLEIKEELIKNGYIFKTTSDTEVVLNSYDFWGKDCFKKFNGMWAIAIFDKKERKIILSRDRFGKKPLYYF
ncbi:MAG: hypothetical protein HQK51_21710 [Oligoflexia bacterium]|nr:hypothetical protein [Oligoflexia bacterium]